MQDSATIVAAIVRGISKDGVVDRDSAPEDWETLDDPESMDLRRELEDALGIKIAKAQPPAQHFNIFPATACSIFATSKEELSSEIGKCANAAAKASGDASYIRAAWALVYHILVAFCFDRDIAPNCLRIDRLETSTFLEHVCSKMKELAADDADSERPDIANVAKTFLSRQESDSPDLKDDRKRTQTQAGLVNHLLIYLAKNGLLDRNLLSEGLISPTQRFCEAYRHFISSRQMLESSLLPYLVEHGL